MKNELAGDLTLAEGKSQYDTYCKRILANKIILAWILKYAAEEFKDMPISQIKTCIGSDIRISEASVLPGRTNLREPEKITGESEEDSVRAKESFVMISGFLYIMPDRKKGLN